MRRELITAIELGQVNNRIVNMLFIVHNENIDLQEAIKKSAAEYLNTDEGLLAYSGNGNSFKWEDFWKVVPNEICLKHGFEKDTVSISRETKVDFNEELVSEKDLVFSEEKLERLKEELFDNGIEVIEAIIVICEFERLNEYLAVGRNRSGEMVKFGNINADVNHEVVPPFHKV